MKELKLPKMFNSWIQFANHCDKLESENPNMGSIVHVHEYPERHTFNVSEVKAMAFDEIKQNQKLEVGTLLKMKEIILQNRSMGDDRYEGIHDVIGVLIDLTK
jgi:hypothetical protein